MSTWRSMLVVSHTARQEAITATCAALQKLAASGVQPVMCASDLAEYAPLVPQLKIHTLGVETGLEQIETTLVLGGDGTILRAAEIVRDGVCPIVGINLGHVGFLAEMESHTLESTLEQVLAGQLEVEERKTLSVKIMAGNELVAETFAVNEATVEKTSRMIELAIGIDGRALTGFGCDGVVLATATGSTAYAFSAGGPIMWPGVTGMLVVPIAAHALFNRPLVLGPEQVVEARLKLSNRTSAALWCDGRRRFEVLPGQRVLVAQSKKPLRMARLSHSPFSERLVNKFNLPVTGWREDACEC